MHVFKINDVTVNQHSGNERKRNTNFTEIYNSKFIEIFTAKFLQVSDPASIGIFK